MQLIFVIINVVALIVVIIIMLIPSKYSSKLTSAISAAAAIIIVYNLYTAVIEYEKNTTEQLIRINENDFIETQLNFLNHINPETINFYNEIYGTTDVNNHALVTVMAQRMENANDLLKLNENHSKDPEYIYLFGLWVNSLTFKKIWPSIKHIYNNNVNILVNQLQKN